MMILYIFPHPDDESFGPAPVMYKQSRAGHEVYLLTLTKGGATKQRFRLNYSIEEMGEVRFNEMKDVAKTLGLTDLTVLDLPDSGLKDVNPIEIEDIVETHIHRIKPDVIVSYSVYGVSGFFDHLVTHAVVKRVFCSLKNRQTGYPKRLAMFTLKEPPEQDGPFKLKASDEEDIDCEITVSEEDIKKGIEALKCYKTYLPVIEKTGIMKEVGKSKYFEFFGENHQPYLEGLFDKLPD